MNSVVLGSDRVKMNSLVLGIDQNEFSDPRTGFSVGSVRQQAG